MPIRRSRMLSRLEQLLRMLTMVAWELGMAVFVFSGQLFEPSRTLGEISASTKSYSTSPATSVTRTNVEKASILSRASPLGSSISVLSAFVLCWNGKNKNIKPVSMNWLVVFHMLGKAARSCAVAEGIQYVPQHPKARDVPRF